MEKHSVHLKTNAGYELRIEQQGGREYWVVPVAMMVEGVHNGSHGPLLYPAEELSRAPAAWNGVPVTINHPAGGVSANAPEMSGQHVGRVYNARWADNKLRAEAWLDVLLVTAMSPETAQLIQEQRPLDVSVGTYTEDELVEGTWNNEHYIAIARNYTPDHLAILPDADGACSWNDGCGIRNNKANKKKGGSMNDKQKDKGGAAVEKQFDIALVGNRLTTNEPGFREISNNIQRQLDGLDTNEKYHMLEEVYDDYFVYRVNDQNSGTTYYKSNYAVQQDGTVTFTDSPVQVRKNVTYETVNNRKRTKFTNINFKKNMQRAKKAPCRIDALIANEATQFTEDHREWLESLEDDQLDLLVPNEVKPPVENKQEPEKKVAEPKVNEKAEEKPKSFEEQFKDMVSNAEKPEDFIDKLFPKELGEQMKAGLKMHRDARERLIKTITENSDFEADELTEFDTARLEKLAKSVAKKNRDYSLNSVTDEDLVDNESEIPQEEIESMLYMELANKPGNGQATS